MPLFASNDDLVRSRLLKLGKTFTSENKPKSILVISAHYETGPSILVTSASQPEMYFDYYGFPKEAYNFKYSAPGNPKLAHQVKDLLTGSNIPCELDPKRGFDHGVFVPLMLAFPNADIPVITLSLHKSFDPTTHIRIGEALQPLRTEGVLIIGSGMSFHNMTPAMRSSSKFFGRDFDKALVEVMKKNPQDRNNILKEWFNLPGARNAHAREEHLLPLLVVAGVAGESIGKADSFKAMKAYISGFAFE